MIKQIIFVALWLGLVGTGLGLGSWQLDRLAWKNDLLAQIEAAYPEPSTSWPDRPVDQILFARLQGPVTFLPDQFSVGPKIFRGAFGRYHYQRAQVLGREMWVLRGFVADGSDFRPAQDGVMVVQIRLSEITIETVLRQNKNISSAMMTATSFDRIAVIEEMAQDGPYPWAVAGARPIPNNNHLAYAIFWLVMSIVALVGGLFMIRQGHSHSGR